MRRETEPPLYRTGTGSYYGESRERPVEDASPQSYFSAGLERIARSMMATADEMWALSKDPRFSAATGSYYSGSRERPVETAATEAYFGAGTGRPMERREMPREEMKSEQYLKYPSGTGSYYSESRERPVEGASPESYFGAGLERISRQMMATADEMWALSKDPRFRAATGSYYSGSRERPVETAATEAYFGAGTGRPMERREMPREEMKSEQYLKYPSGTGSYYSESRERPVEDASPGSYFGAGLERISRQMMAVAEDMSAMSRDPRFRAGTGSYYSGSRERPVEEASQGVRRIRSD